MGLFQLIFRPDFAFPLGKIVGVTVAGRASGEASKIVTGKQVGLFQLMFRPDFAFPLAKIVGVTASGGAYHSHIY